MDIGRSLGIVIFLITLSCSEVKAQRRKETTREIFGFYKIESISVSNCTNHTSDKVIYMVDVAKTPDGDITITTNMTVLEDIDSLTSKFRLYRKLGKDKTKQIMNVNIPNICEYVFKDVLPKKGTAGCHVPKGVYDNLVFEVMKYAKSIIGQKFFYGTYGYEVQVFSGKELVICTLSIGQLVSVRPAKG